MKQKADIFDLFFVLGVCGVFYGLWLLSPWIAYAATGALLVIVSLAAVLLRRVPGGRRK